MKLPREWAPPDCRFHARLAYRLGSGARTAATRNPRGRTEVSLVRIEQLPHEFTGVRSAREAEHDLLVIARAGAPLDGAHVWVDPDDGAVVKRTGHLTAEPRELGRLTVLVDCVALFDFEARRCRGAWLWTADGADYYRAKMDLGWGCVALSDAYNGL